MRDEFTPFPPAARGARDSVHNVPAQSDPLRELTSPNGPTSQRSLLFPQFAAVISRLSNDQLAGRVPLDPALRLFEDGELESWYTPFEHVNPDAKIVLVGITPGRSQLLNALREAKLQLVRGASTAEALAAAKHVGAFSGPLRKHLVTLLDHAGFHKALGVPASADLFGRSSALLQTTSILRHAVFYKRKNYNGTPNMLRQPALRQHILAHFAGEATRLPNAVFVPLGGKVADALYFLADQGVLAPDRILAGLPHPSPANVERIHFFTGQKSEGALSAKTNAAKLTAARANLQQRVAQLSSAWPNS